MCVMRANEWCELWDGMESSSGKLVELMMMMLEREEAATAEKQC
jgi:hypothetical protein